MFFDPLYWIVIGIGMAIGLAANAMIKGRFAKYSKIATQSHMTGAEIARAILRDNGIHDVDVQRVAGNLTDHYDPRSKTLRLSDPVYASNSMAAFGVAAHEVGHAIQHAQGYAMLQFRSWWVPMANLGGSLSWIVILAAFFMGGAQTLWGERLAWMGISLFGATTLFTLVTLPVEFDASRRALANLRGRYVTDAEYDGARKVLTAAAMTYVAAFITSALTLLYWAYRLGLFGGRRSND